MSTITLTEVAAMPRVNLLPPEFAEIQRFRRVQTGLGAAVVLALLAVAALYMAATSQVGGAREDLEAGAAEGTQLQKQQAQYAAVPAVGKELELADARLATALGEEVRWSQVLNDLGLTVPQRVWLTSLKLQQATAEPVPAGGTTPVLATGLGSMSFEGKAFDYRSVATLLDALAKQKGCRDVYSTSVKADERGEMPRATVSYTAQCTLTEPLLSKRYTKGGSLR